MPRGIGIGEYAMGKHDTFLKGDPVKFQDRTFTWREGEVQCVERSSVHVLYRDSAKRQMRVIVLPTKRVKPAVKN